MSAAAQTRRAPAQDRHGGVRDICTSRKIIGGRTALAALGASTDIMTHVDTSIVAGVKTVWVLRRDGQ